MFTLHEQFGDRGGTRTRFTRDGLNPLKLIGYSPSQSTCLRSIHKMGYPGGLEPPPAASQAAMLPLHQGHVLPASQVIRDM